MRDEIAKAFKLLIKAADERVKVEDELDAIKSKSEKEQRLFEDENP
jgi:hypothetical protein